MYYLNEDIKLYGKHIEFICNTYRNIYSELVNSWEMDYTVEEDDKYDLKLILNQKWKDYEIYSKNGYMAEIS